MRENDSIPKRVFSKNKTVVRQKAGNDSNNYSFINSVVINYTEGSQLPNEKDIMRNNHTYNEGCIFEKSSFDFECGDEIPISVESMVKVMMAAYWEKQRHFVIEFGQITDCFEAQKVYRGKLRPNLDKIFSYCPDM